jgi:hypothetical protein
MGGDEALAIGFVDGNGFFDQHVQAGVEGFDADGGVGEVGGADEDGVDVTGTDHGVHIGKRMFALEKGWQGADAFAEGGDAHAWDFAGADVVEVGFAHVAEADDSESDDFHSGMQASGLV